MSDLTNAQKRAAIPNACSCPLDSCACNRRVDDGAVCDRCLRDHDPIAQR